MTFYAAVTYPVTSFCESDLAAADKGGTFSTLTLTGVAALHADFSGVTFTVVIILTIRRLTVYACAVRCGSCNVRIAVCIPFLAFLEAVTACLLRCLRAAASYLYLIQVTQKLFVVHTCLHGTF